MKLSFNPSLLLPLNYKVYKIDSKNAYIIIDSIAVSQINGDTLINVIFKSALGNSERCDLLLSDAKAIGGNCDFEYLIGSFELLGVCPEGGNRLLNVTDKGGILIN